MSLQQWPVCVLQHCRVGRPLPLAGVSLPRSGSSVPGAGAWCLDQVIHPNTVQHCRHGEVETPVNTAEMEIWRETGELTVIMLQTGGQLTTCNTLTTMEIETYPTDIFLNRIQ